MQAVRLGTREYIDTFKKKKEAEPDKSAPEEPPIIDDLRKPLSHQHPEYVCSVAISHCPLICFSWIFIRDTMHNTTDALH